MSSSRWNAVLLLALVGVGAFAWFLLLREPLRPEVSSLSQLPASFGSWDSIDLPIESAVEAELGADLNIQRVYLGPTGDPIWMYMGYYGTASGGRPEHTPRGCYPGAGWSIEETRVLEVEPTSRLRVNEYLIEREGETRLVHFWYRSHRRSGMLGGLDQNVDRILGRILDGRADGALIRVSTPLGPGDSVAARGRLMAFAAALDPLVGERWPAEGPSS